MDLDEMLALLPDNTTGDISAADLRSIVTGLYDDASTTVAPGPFDNLPGSAQFTPLPAPGPVVGVVHLDEPRMVLVTLTAYIDTGSNNNAVSLGLDLSGATLLPAGTNPEQTIRLGGKSLVASTISVTYMQQINIGDTTVEVMYKASQSGADISGIAATRVQLS